MVGNANTYLGSVYPVYSPGRKTELLIGFVAAISVAIFVWAPRTFGVFASLVIFGLSATANEIFLLFLIAFLPLSWVIKTDLPVRDLMPVAHLVAVFGFLAGKLWRRELDVRRWFKFPLTRASFYFAAIAIASVALSHGWTHESERDLFRLASYLGMFLLVLSWPTSSLQLERIMRVLLISTIVVSTFAIIQELAGGYTGLWSFFNPPDEYPFDWSGRSTSFLAYPTVLAGYLNMVMPFALACVVLGKGQWRRLGAWTLSFGFIALLCTQSLGGLIGLGSVVFLAICYFGRTWTLKLFMMGLILAFVSGFYGLREILNPAHADMTLQYDLAIRFALWASAIIVFLQSPIYGVGWGNFVGSEAANLNFASWMPTQVQYANNFFLDLLSGVGIVGFVCFAILAYRGIRLAHLGLRDSPRFFNKALSFGVLGALVASLMHGLVDDVMVVSPQAATLLWVLLALLTLITGPGILEDIHLARPQTKSLGKMAFDQ